MTRFTASLLRLIGRIREDMDAVYMGLATMFIPAGITFLTFWATSLDKLTWIPPVGILCLLVGTASIGLAIHEVRKNEAKRRTEDKKIRAHQSLQFLAMQKTNVILLSTAVKLGVDLDELTKLQDVTNQVLQDILEEEKDK